MAPALTTIERRRLQKASERLLRRKRVQHLLDNILARGNHFSWHCPNLLPTLQERVSSLAANACFQTGGYKRNIRGRE